MTTISPRRAAIIAGIGYAAIFVLAIFANFFVREGLVVAGDAAATFANIAESETLFRAGTAPPARYASTPGPGTPAGITAGILPNGPVPTPRNTLSVRSSISPN